MNQEILKSIIFEQREDILNRKELFTQREVDLSNHLHRPEISIIKGVRRCGKSSLLRQIYRANLKDANSLFINFDDPRLQEFESSDFEKIYKLWLADNQQQTVKGQKIKGILYFDEIQNVTSWEKWMSFFAEQKKFKVFITGSNSTMLSSDLATRLTGRHIDVELYPFSFSEVIKDINPKLYQAVVKQQGVLTLEQKAKLLKYTNDYIAYGGFPRAWLERDSSILSDYYQDILYKDIVKRHKVREPKLLLQLGNFLLNDMSRLINKSKLARDLEIKEQRTVVKFTSYFLESYLGFEIKKFSSSLRKQSRNLTKFYAIDSALARRLSFAPESRFGAFLENLVFLHLQRKNLEVFYWISEKNQEVDFVCSKMGQITAAIQVASSLQNPETEKREVRALQALFEKENNLRQAYIITLDEEREIVLGKKIIKVIPFYKWALVEKN